MKREYVVVYDILSEGLALRHFTPLLVCAGLVAVFGGAFAWARKAGGVPAVVTGFGAAFCLCIGGCGGGHVLYQRVQCLNWARSGQFEVVEGEVRDFKPMPEHGHARESFTVSKVPFSYSAFDASTGAFNNAASHGGPIREGLHVRISHHDGRILKIEVRK